MFLIVIDNHGYNDHGHNDHGHNNHGYNIHGYNDHVYNNHGYDDHGNEQYVCIFWSWSTVVTHINYHGQITVITI